MKIISDNHWLKKRPIAHRGLHNEKIVENTKEAIKEAIKNGYPIEIDVSITKENKLILFHDENIKRLTGIDKKVYDLTSQDLETIKYKNTDSKILSLKSALSLVAGSVPLLIELKSYRSFWNASKIAKETFELLKNYKGGYAIQSFCITVPKIYNKLDENALVGLIAPLHLRNKILSNAFLLISLLFYRHDFISYNIKHMPNCIIENSKLTKLFWVIKTKEEERKALKYKGNLIWDNSNYKPPKVI